MGVLTSQVGNEMVATTLVRCFAYFNFSTVELIGSVREIYKKKRFTFTIPNYF